ncbi:MAG: hypothetical protein ACUZ8O_12470 [Candidatus Anammoxibacter sp.]
MPITKELKNIKTFESAGFTHEQAESLTDVIEESHADSQESLKEFISNENDKLLAGINSQFKDVFNEFKKQTKDFDLKLGALDNKLSQQISDLTVNIATSHKDLSQQISDLAVNMDISQKDLLVKIFAIIVGTVGVAVTIIKVF